MKSKIGQVFTTDLIIGIIIFILIFGAVLFFFLRAGEQQAIPDLVKDGQTAATKLTSSESTLIVEDKEIDYVELNRISNLDYEDLKNELGIRSDFCIYIVDLDGNVIPIRDTSVVGLDYRYSIGDDSGIVNITKNSTGGWNRCGQLIRGEAP